MRRTRKIRRDCLPREIIDHLEQQGLGWGHDLDLRCFYIKGERRHGR